MSIGFRIYFVFILYATYLIDLIQLFISGLRSPLLAQYMQRTRVHYICARWPQPRPHTTYRIPISCPRIPYPISHRCTPPPPAFRCSHLILSYLALLDARSLALAFSDNRCNLFDPLPFFFVSGYILLTSMRKLTTFKISKPKPKAKPRNPKPSPEFKPSLKESSRNPPRNRVCFCGGGVIYSGITTYESNRSRPCPRPTPPM